MQRKHGEQPSQGGVLKQLKQQQISVPGFADGLVKDMARFAAQRVAFPYWKGSAREAGWTVDRRRWPEVAVGEELTTENNQCGMIPQCQPIQHLVEILQKKAEFTGNEVS